MTVVAFVYILVLLADRLTKVSVSSWLSLGDSVPLTGFLRLTLVHNRGAAFGLFTNHRPLLIGLGLLVSVGVFWVAWALRSEGRWPLVALSLIGGGTAGNLFDRIVYGYVVDFVDVLVWPVFNVADSALVVGSIMLGWFIIRSSAPGNRPA